MSDDESVTSSDGTERSEGYWYTEIDYHHPYDAPDADSVSILTWYRPSGLRASAQGRVQL